MRKSRKSIFLVIAAIIAVFIAASFFIAPKAIDVFIKNKIIAAYTKAFPKASMRIAKLHFNVIENRIDLEGLAIASKDSAFSYSAGALSVSGISWLSFLGRGDIPSAVLKATVLDAHGIIAVFRKPQYKLQCAQLHVSMPDSAVSIEDLEIAPTVKDDAFFANNKFGTTRFKVNMPRCIVYGADCLKMILGRACTARSIIVINPQFDVLADMDVPNDPNSAKPVMPCEAIELAGKTVRIDNAFIQNGRCLYKERYVVGRAPALVSFDAIRLSVKGIANKAAHGKIAQINGRCIFMKTSTMKIRMAIPMVLPGFPIKYYGSLNMLDLRRLNSFLEIAEGLRIKAGTLETVTFDVTINVNQSSGMLQALYKDLDIAIVDSTGNENGLKNKLASFIANSIKIRSANMPDKPEPEKTGAIKYTRKPDDTFIKLIWFSLRSGIGDIVGFSSGK